MLHRAMQVFENAILNCNLSCKKGSLEDGAKKVLDLIRDEIEVYSDTNQKKPDFDVGE